MHYVSDQPLFPRDQMITYAESLCAFPFGVRLAGFKVRPKLVCGQIVLDSLHISFLRPQSRVLMFHRVTPKTRFACYFA